MAQLNIDYKPTDALTPRVRNPRTHSEAQIKQLMRSIEYFGFTNPVLIDADANLIAGQREACEAYIASQKHEGWELLPDRFDDGGISGGHMERPALKELMQAIRDKRVDQIVVYKIDRLTRSLADFAKIVDVLDAAETSFVSVTQSFNTATSMGRLTLNMLLSFAQFEREVTAERIRDKIAASKKKGLWMGGNIPLGYRPDGRTLEINEEEAPTVRTIYDLYLKHRRVRLVKMEADKLGLQTALRKRSDGSTIGGQPISQGHVHHILANPIYAGRIRHKEQVFDGQHPAIIDPEVWEKVQKLLKAGAAKARGTKQKADRSLLAGKIFDETGDRLTPSHSQKNGKRLRYYISRRLVVDRSSKHPDAWRLPAEQLETMVADVIQQHLRKPTTASELLSGATAPQMISAGKKLSATKNATSWMTLAERIDLERLPKLLNCKPEHLNPDALSITSPFQMHRRGVELKLHLGEAQPEVDRTLIQNIVTAQKLLRMVIDGKSIQEISEIKSVPKSRIQDLLDLALLSPETLDTIANGKQPDGLTSDYLIKTGFSPIWSEQQKQFAKL